MNKIEQNSSMPPVMILCGGRGTRLQDVTELLPKPMVPIGEQPILWHIMRTYAAFGVRRFILCLGYKRETFIDYFVNFHLRTADATVKLGHNAEIKFHSDVDEANWEVTLAGTGLDSMTATRIVRASKYLAPDDQNFFLTYGDGLCDVNLDDLYRFHRKSDKLLTITAVHPSARFGEIAVNGDELLGFQEKPDLSRGYINGGFMVLRRELLSRYLNPDKDVYFEAEPMQALISDHQVQVFRHEGFWQCMDTPREYQKLNQLWNSGENAPWTKYWDRNKRV